MRCIPFTVFWLMTLAVGTAGADTSPTPHPPSPMISPGWPQTTTREVSFATDSGLTPADLVRRALHSNLDLVAARIDIERARARLTQAQLFPNPVLEAERVGGGGTQERAVTVTMPVPLFGRRAASVARAQAEFFLAEADLRSREREIVGAALTAHAAVLATARALQLTQQLEEINQGIRKLVAARVQEKDAPPLDLKILDVEIHRLEARDLVARGQVRAEVAALRALLGMGPEDPMELRTEFVLTPPAVRSADAAFMRAREQRPDLRAARAREAVAVTDIAVAKSEGRPEMGFFGRYSTKTGTSVFAEDERLFGGGVSISLPAFNRNQGAIAEATAAERQARARTAALERTARAEIDNAYIRYETAQRAVLIFERDVNPATSENLATLREAYTLGAIPLSEVLAEQRRMIDAETEFTEALNAAYRASADLQLATGEDLAGEGKP